MRKIEAVLTDIYGEIGRKGAGRISVRLPAFIWISQKVSRMSYHTAPPWVDWETPSFTKPNFS